MTTLNAPHPHVRSKLSIADDVLILFADLQGGIADLPLTVPQAQLKRGVRALTRLAEIFLLPKLITAVPGNGGKMPALIPELEAARQEAPVYVRTTPNSMNDAEIRVAIEHSGRRLILVAGVATEVAVQLPSLTLAAEGFDVHVVVDACGGISERTEEAAMRRMSAAGVKTTSIATLIGELAGDFRESRGQQAIGVLFELAGG